MKTATNNDNIPNQLTAEIKKYSDYVSTSEGLIKHHYSETIEFLRGRSRIVPLNKEYTTDNVIRNIVQWINILSLLKPYATKKNFYKIRYSKEVNIEFVCIFPPAEDKIAKRQDLVLFSSAISGNNPANTIVWDISVGKLSSIKLGKMYRFVEQNPRNQREDDDLLQYLTFERFCLARECSGGSIATSFISRFPKWEDALRKLRYEMDFTASTFNLENNLIYNNISSGLEKEEKKANNNRTKDQTNGK